MLTHLCELQPAECAAGRGGELEVLLGCHPRLHGLQLACGQVGGMVLDQVALELVWLEVEMHWHWVAHGEVPGSARTQRESISKPDSCWPVLRADSVRGEEYLDSSGYWLEETGLGHANVAWC